MKTNERAGTTKHEKGEFCDEAPRCCQNEDGLLRIPVLCTPRGQFFSLPLSSIEKNILRDEIAECQEAE